MKIKVYYSDVKANSQFNLIRHCMYVELGAHDMYGVRLFLYNNKQKMKTIFLCATQPVHFCYLINAVFDYFYFIFLAKLGIIYHKYTPIR